MWPLAHRCQFLVRLLRPLAVQDLIPKEDQGEAQLQEQCDLIVGHISINIHNNNAAYLEVKYANGNERERERDTWLLYASENGFLSRSLLQTMGHYPRSMRDGALKSLFQRACH